MGRCARSAQLDPYLRCDAPEGTDVLEVDSLHRLTRRTRQEGVGPAVVEGVEYNAIGAVRTHGGGVLDDQRAKRGGGGTAGAAVPSRVDARAVTLDGVGQVTQVGTASLTWTLSGQLTQVEDGGAREVYGYDALGRRVSRGAGPSAGALTTLYYTYDGANESLEVSSTASLQRAWLYDGVDHPLRMRDLRAGAEPLVYYELDLAGNVRRLRAPGGGDLGGYKYAAFGALAAPDAATPAPTGLLAEQPWRWKGRWWSPRGGGAGTYDVRARTWSPELGVFLSIDEFAYHDARSTLWGWPGQNPYRYRDPSGRTSDENIDNEKPLSFGAAPETPEAKAALGLAMAPYAAATLAGAGITLGWMFPTSAFGRFFGFGGVSAVGQKLNESGGGCSAPASVIDPNRLNHIFGNQSHQRDPLVERVGSREAALSAIQQAAQAAAEKAGTANGGLFDGRVNVAGMDVRVWGRMMDGVLRVYTASARPEP